MKRPFWGVRRNNIELSYSIFTGWFCRMYKDDALLGSCICIVGECYGKTKWEAYRKANAGVGSWVNHKGELLPVHRI